MDIKSKNKNKNLNSRILILVICISILPVFTGGIGRYLPKGIMYRSQIVINHINHIYQGGSYLRYIAEDSSGKLKENALQDGINNKKNSYLYDYNYYKEEVDKAKAQGFEGWVYSGNEEQMKSAQEGLNRSDDEIRAQVIDEYEHALETYISALRASVNVEYYFEREDENKPFTNVPGKTREEFEKETLSGAYNDYIIINGTAGRSGKVGSNISDTLIDFTNYNSTIFNQTYDVYLRIANPLKSGDFLYTQSQHYKSSKNLGYASIVLLAIDVLCIIVLMISIVRKFSKVKQNILIKLYRKLFLEIRLLSYIGIVALILSTYSNVYWANIRYIILNLILLNLLGYLAFSDLFIMVDTYKERKLKVYWLEKSITIKIVRLIKESMMIKSTAIRVICSIIYLVAYATLMHSTGIFIRMHSIYNIFTILLFVASVFMTLWIIYYVLIVGKQINRLKISTDNIVNGNYNNNMEIEGPMILKDIAKNVINIEDGLSKAVEKAVSSEKMKGELITNVSHDLKTPLTSIINYVDLLSKENVSDDDKEKYIEVLKEKSSRLKVLIEDLFEASKAASGSMELSMENIDPVALLRQTIGEFEDRIDDSGLQFIKRIPEEKLMIYADGRKTFRVFQNLLSNILKYSMPYSRVYIEVKELEKVISITFKNISKFELSFSEEEIIERFKRGDESRTTEGSGLGLSIAKSLVELQGGDFNISIDGDLFKVIVTLRKSNSDSK